MFVKGFADEKHIILFICANSNITSVNISHQRPREKQQNLSLHTMMTPELFENESLAVAGKKRGLEENNSEICMKNKSLKEQVAILTKVQNNLIKVLKNVVGVSEEHLSDCLVDSDISFEPIKRNPRITPGIYTDDENRKYYINSYGVFVYKRPCGKPKKYKAWCYSKGEWVDPGQNVEENVANTFKNVDDYGSIPEEEINSNDSFEECEDVRQPLPVVSDDEYSDNEASDY